jgi:hypothetical protein
MLFNLFSCMSPWDLILTVTVTIQQLAINKMMVPRMQMALQAG